MKTEDQWQRGIVYRRPDGTFALVERREDVPHTGTLQYQDVRYRWQNGRPLVDFGDFTATVDIA